MDIVIKSILAAGVTALILVLEKIAGPRVAGAIGGIPIVFAIAFIMVTMQSKEITHIGQFLQGGIIGAIAAVLFCAVLWFLNARFIEHYWLNFVGAYVLCFLFALTMSSVMGRS